MASDNLDTERVIPSGWRQQCAQGHRSGLARKCKLNNHGSIYISPDGGRFDDLESVHEFLYGAKGDLWEEDSPSLEEIDLLQIQQQQKRQRTDRYPVNQNLHKRPIVSTVFRCEECGTGFLNNDYLTLHKKNKHSSNKAVFNSSKTPQTWNDTVQKNTFAKQTKVTSKPDDEVIIEDIDTPIKTPVNNMLYRSAIAKPPTNYLLDRNTLAKPHINNVFDRAKTVKPQVNNLVARSALVKPPLNNIVNRDKEMKAPSNNVLANAASKLEQWTTLKSQLNLSSILSPKQASTVSPKTVIRTGPGVKISIKQNTQPDPTFSDKIEHSKSFLASINSVKSSSSLFSLAPTVRLSMDPSADKNIQAKQKNDLFKVMDVYSKPKVLDVGGDLFNNLRSKRSEKSESDVTKKPSVILGPFQDRPKPVAIDQTQNLKPIMYFPDPKVLSNEEEQELAQQEMLFLVAPLKCYFCELGRSRMSKSDPAEFFHLQLEMNGHLGKGNPSNKEVENLATYLRVNIGIARKVLQHIGVSNQTKESKIRLSFIRRLCWDNMESLSDLCNSFEQVWRAVQMNKDTFNISQEVLGQVYRWKFLYQKDSHYQTFMNKIFIHIHQAQNNVYSFMRNQVVEIEID